MLVGVWFGVMLYWIIDIYWLVSGLVSCYTWIIDICWCVVWCHVIPG